MAGEASASASEMGACENRRVKPRQLLVRLAAGHLQNVAFRDLQSLVEAMGFRQLRVEGSHHIYGRDEVSEQLNLQSVRGEAKPYQIRQFLRLVERYGLRIGDEE